MKIYKTDQISALILRCVLIFLFFGFFSLGAETRFTLVTTPAGPQIAVDGTPVSARMFWGKPGFGQVTATGTWSEQSFEFSTAFDARATLHFRFGHKAGTVELADVRLTKVADGTEILPPGSFATPAAFHSIWNIFPPDERNTVATVEIADSLARVRLTDPPAGTGWPDFHFWSDTRMLEPGTRYRCSFRVRARPGRDITPAVYHALNGWTAIGGPPGPFTRELGMARDAGVNFVSFIIANCWVPPEVKPDWRHVDAVFRRVLDTHPDAWIVPRVSLDAPAWWLERHPQARMVFEDGSTGSKASISHRQYRADAAAHLKDLCRHLSETFPDHFAGIHPCGQNTGEWFYENSWGARLSGFGPATQQAWQAAGGGQVPFAAARRSADHCLLLDPATQGTIIRFNRFLQHEMADFILELAAAARRGTGGNKLIFFFYGYHYEFGRVFNGPAASGHYGLSRVLASPDIDILCAPLSYQDRGLLGTGPVMSPAESVLASGTLWFNEDDTRTYLNTNAEDHARHGGLDTREQTRSVLLRNTAQAWIRGLGTWWMDHGARTPGGWFDDPALWQVFKDLEPVETAMRSRSHLFQPDIAAIVDENSVLHLAGGSALIGGSLISDARLALGRCGAPYGQYLLQDVLEARVNAQLQIFLAAWALTPQQRQQLAESRPPGITRVWCYAPGYILPQASDVTAMQPLTGFEHHLVHPTTATATPTGRGRELGLSTAWGPDQAVEPLFSVTADTDEVLAVYDDGSPAVAVRQTETGTDVFVGPPELSPGLIRVLAKLAAVHLYAKTDAAVWASENIVSVHGVQDPPIVFDTGAEAPVRDALSGKLVSSRAEFSFNLHAGDTRVLTWEPPTAAAPARGSAPRIFSLQQNYPNPFNPGTTFSFSLTAHGPVSLVIYDLLGREVARPIDNQIMPPGEHTVPWTPGTLPAGLYIFRLQTASGFLQKKCLLVK